jgi:tRNA(Ile)-lysidine synthase
MIASPSGKALLAKVTATLDHYGMVEKGSGIVVAVSGGPDSVAMLRLLNELKSDFDLRMVVAHLDHGLRTESHLDAEFVRRLAQELDLPFQVERTDVRSLAAAAGISVEEAGRRARYSFFERIREATDAGTVATAHHRDDELETFFLRILRGSSLMGLKGIPPVRGRIIRPLITSCRAEVLAFLVSEGYDFCVDRTNLEAASDRNFIRNRFLPLVRERFPEFGAPLKRTMDLIRKEDEFIESEAMRIYAHSVSHEQEDLVFDLASLKHVPEVLFCRIILLGLYELSGPDVRWQRVHAESVFHMVRGRNPSAIIDLPAGLKVWREYEKVRLSAQTRVIDAPFRIVVNEPGRVEIPRGGMHLEFRVSTAARVPSRDQEGSRAVFDAEGMSFPIVLRPPKPGDRFRPWGMDGVRKLKKVLIDAKVPRRMRTSLPLLVKDDEIVWIPGVRRSSWAPVTNQTVRFLEVEALEP